jgi:hypothetical protein
VISTWRFSKLNAVTLAQNGRILVSVWLASKLSIPLQDLVAGFSSIAVVDSDNFIKSNSLAFPGKSPSNCCPVGMPRALSHLIKLPHVSTGSKRFDSLHLLFCSQERDVAAENGWGRIP